MEIDGEMERNIDRERGELRDLLALSRKAPRHAVWYQKSYTVGETGIVDAWLSESHAMFVQKAKI